MDERFLYHIWDEGHFQGELLTIAGKHVNVVYRGHYNTNRGPDFKNAIIEIDGLTHRGSVEIHINTSDWKSHNHHEDPYYNETILHVVLNHNTNFSYTILENGSSIEILQVKDKLSNEISKLMHQRGSIPISNTYCDLLSAIDSDRLKAILTFSGIKRLDNKVQRFNAFLGLTNFDQIIYEAILECLGYDKNKHNTMLIAQSISWYNLQEYKHEGMNAEDLLSILLCSTSLINHCSKNIGQDRVDTLKAIYEKQKWVFRKIDIPWNLFRIRPFNHPAIRLMSISPFLWENLDDGLLSAFSKCLELSIESPGSVFKCFQQLWHTKNNRQMYETSLGSNILQIMYLNVYIPIMTLWADKMGNHTYRSRLKNEYLCLSGLQENHVLKLMYRNMTENQTKLIRKKAVYQQGLMDIYFRNCNWHNCTECILDAGIEL